jgi:hypothetical protein
MLNQLACSEVELQAAEDAVRLRRREGLIEGTQGMGRQVVEHDADLLGAWIVQIDQVAHALGKVAAARLSVTLTLRQGRYASRKTNRLTVPLRRC